MADAIECHLRGLQVQRAECVLNIMLLQYDPAVDILQATRREQTVEDAMDVLAGLALLHAAAIRASVSCGRALQACDDRVTQPLSQSVQRGRWSAKRICGEDGPRG